MASLFSAISSIRYTNTGLKTATCLKNLRNAVNGPRIFGVLCLKVNCSSSPSCFFILESASSFSALTLPSSSISIHNSRFSSSLPPLLQCWNCENKIEPSPSGVSICFSCQTLQPLSPLTDFFTIFGLPKEFDITLEELTQKFRGLQRELHPDKFATRSEKEREISSEYSSFINKGYRTLLDAYERGLYLLHLNGIHIQEDEDEIKLDGPFLMEIMELNEKIVDCEADGKALGSLQKENAAKIESLHTRISAAFKANNLNEAKQLLALLKFYNNAAEKIHEKL